MSSMKEAIYEKSYDITKFESSFCNSPIVLESRLAKLCCIITKDSDTNAIEKLVFEVV